MTRPNQPAFTAVRWRKSSHSTGVNECVEVAHAATRYAVRDSKNPGGGHLTLDAPDWHAFLADIKQGRYDY